MTKAVRTAKKYDKLTPTEEAMARVLEGRTIPKRLITELKKAKKAEGERKAKKAKSRRRAFAW